jgi:hypothetical protein
MDSSKFHLWRGCISFCFIDSELSGPEKKWIEEKSQKLPFTAEQRITIAEDLNHPPDIRELLPLITKPSDRAFLVDQMRVLAAIDGKVTAEEKEMIREIKDYVLSKVYLPELEAIIAQDERASYHEEEVYQVHNKHSVLERMHRYFQKALNPGDYQMPKK